jgi:phage head maturation protease
MKNLITRAGEPFDFTGRTLEGVALRYERASRVSDDNWKTSYYEEYARRAAAKSLQDGGDWPLTRQHQGDGLGSVSFHNSDDEGALMFRALVAPGSEGDHLIDDVNSGEWRDVSIGAYVIRSGQRMAPFGAVTVRQEIKLDHLTVAMTGSGLMSGAEVTVVRAAEEGTPRLELLRKKLILL